MSELELYKFLESDAVQQYNWSDDGKEFLVWIDIYNIKDFIDLIGRIYLVDNETNVNLQYYCIYLDIVDIAEYYEIDLENILKKEGN